MAAEFVEDNLHGMLRSNVQFATGRDRIRHLLEAVVESNESAANAVAEPLAKLLEEVFFTFGTEDASPEADPAHAIDAFVRLAEKIRVDALPELTEGVVSMVGKGNPRFAYGALARVLADEVLKMLRKERADDVDVCTDIVLTVLQEAVEKSGRSTEASEALAPTLQRASELIAGANIELQPQVLARYIHDRGAEATLALMERKYGLVVGAEFDSRETATPRAKAFTLEPALLDPDPKRDAERDYSKLAPPVGAVHISEHSLNLRGLPKGKLRSIVDLFERACHQVPANLDRVSNALARRRYAGGQQVQVKSLLDVDGLTRLTSRSLRDIEHLGR